MTNSAPVMLRLSPEHLAVLEETRQRMEQQAPSGMRVNCSDVLRHALVELAKRMKAMKK